MSQRLRKATALLICAFLLSPALAAARADDDSFVVTLGKAAGSSAAGKGGEFAVKLIGGLIYDSSCKGANLGDATRYICDVLGSVTGKNEEAWKANVDKQLREISQGLATLTAGQQEIARELTQMHKQMELEFEQAALKLEATKAIVRIEGTWKKYQAELKPGSVPKKAEMLELATNIIREQKLDQALQDFDVALTTKVLEGQPMLRYPMYKWRETKGFSNFRFEGQQVYDFAEKKFMEYRNIEEKAYLMYLWAATVIESNCAIQKTADCKPKLPVSSEKFRADFARYTRDQVEVFNAAADWLLLSYGNQFSSPDATLPARYESTVARANFLTAALLAPQAKGMWGRVLSMGNAWDGSLKMSCAGKTQTIKPVFSYTVPAEGNAKYSRGYNRDYGPLDWWSSSKRNATYDEVHFASDWRVFHYSLPDVAAGTPCTVGQVLPEGGVMPWAQSGTQVAQVKTADGKTLPFGSFVAVQRAGGTYALMSGAGWAVEARNHVENPDAKADQRGVIKLSDNQSLVEPGGHPAGPWIGVRSAGRGEFFVKSATSLVEIGDKIATWMNKPIRITEGPSVAVNMIGTGECKNVCQPGSIANDDTVLSYNIENNDADKKRGNLRAWAGIYLARGHLGVPSEAKGQGIYIDHSYDDKGQRMTADVKGYLQSGTAEVQAGATYYLNSVIDFFARTQGRGVDATTWSYRARLMPQQLFLSKK